MQFGKEGQLIVKSFDRAVFKIDPINVALNAFGQNKTDDIQQCMIQVFDNKMGEWRLLHLYEIPRTYSFLPVPSTKEMELEYFLRTSCLPKHEVFWSTDSIPMDIFARITTKSNTESRGRYTIAPWLPKLSTMPKLCQHGFLEFDH